MKTYKIGAFFGCKLCVLSKLMILQLRLLLLFKMMNIVSLHHGKGLWTIIERPDYLDITLCINTTVVTIVTALMLNFMRLH